MERTWTGETDLLCERCGYDVGGLDRSGRCPECGVPIAESAPERRTGSPWQQRPSPRAWVLTGWLMLRRPVRMYARVRIGGRELEGLLLSNVWIGGLLLTGVPSLGEFGPGLAHARDAQERAWAAMLAVAITLVASMYVAVALTVLTWIERVGIGFFGRRRGWRVTRTVARTICAHAAVGWVISGVLALLGYGLGVALLRFSMTHRLDALRGAFMLAPFWMPAVGFFAGLLVFETLAYVGMRKMRYANPPAREPDGPDA